MKINSSSQHRDVFRLFIVFILLCVSAFTAQHTHAQSEEEFLESIEDELKDEETKKKELEEKEKEYDKLKAKAQKALDKEDFKEAETLYRRLKKIFPDRDYAERQIRLVKQKKEQKELAERDERYKEAMDEGDKQLGKQKWDKAKAAYQKAMKINPEEDLPKQKVKEVVQLKEEEEKRKREEEKQKQYDNLISDADKALDKKDFEEARKKYKAANNVKPDEKYPKDQLIVVQQKEHEEEERKKQQALDEKYNNIIERADELLKNKEWNKATAEYKKAAELKREEAYPKDQIAEAERLKQEEAERIEREKKEAEYNKHIEKADDLLKNKKWDEAIAEYDRAADVLPKETYPKEQSAKAAELKAKAEKEAEEAERQAEIQEQYDKLISNADKLFGSDRYEEAVEQYREAEKVKTDEDYPSEQIAKAEKAIEEARASEERAEKEAEYEKLLGEGDGYIAAKKWDEGIEAFKKASRILEHDDRAKDRLKKAEQQKTEAMNAEAKAEAVQKAYDEAMAEGAAAEENEDWGTAISAYKKAAEAKPEQKEAEEKLKAAEQAKKFAGSAAKKEAERERQEQAKRDQYDQMIAKADKALNEENWSEAKANYKQASDLFPEEEYPIGQIEEAEKRKKAKEKALRKKHEDAAQKAREIEDQYEGLIRQAEDAAEINEYEAAASYLKQAKELKPTAEKPDRMLKGIERKLAEIESARKKEREEEEHKKAVQEKFNNTLAKADKALNNDDFVNAISLYKQALDMQPENNEIEGKIEKARSLMEERKRLAEEKRREEEEQLEKLNEKYSELMGKGETEVQQKNWTQAKSYFRQAQQVKPAAAGPKERIADVERLINKEESEAKRKAEQERKRKEREEQYQNFVARADQEFENNNWSQAKKYYREAVDLKSDSDYAKKQLSKSLEFLEKEEREQRKEQREKNFGSAITAGDKALSEQNFDRAINAFKEALKYKQNNKEAYSKLEEARERRDAYEKEQSEKRLAQIAAAKEEARQKAREEKEKKEEEKRKRIEQIQANKPENLANSYPEGISNEEIDQGHRVVTKTIVVEGGEGRKLIKLSYPWGQEFYYLNGRQISGGAYRHNLRKYL